MRRIAHLAGAFVRGLWPGPPSHAAREWAIGHLTDPERQCFARMPGRDQREGIRTARRLDRALGGPPDDAVMAAALLHDAGKRESGLGVYGRTVATVAGGLAGHGWALAWSERDGFVRRCGLYLRHDEAGEAMLRVAGARELPCAWARVHHEPDRWSEIGLAPELAAALARADGEIVRGA